LERVRAAVVLALAPILALGLFLGARTVVSDEPSPVAVKPTSVVWSGRVFTNEGRLATWLESRDKSYRRWVALHPSATWFHHAQDAVPAAAVAAAPPSTPAKSGSSDLLKLLLVGLLIAFGVALTAGALRFAGGLIASRRGDEAFAGIAAGGTRAPAARPASPPPAKPKPAMTSSGVARQLERAKVYAPPRVMPNLSGRSAAAPAAKVIPLYAAPDPKPEVEPEPETQVAAEPERVAIEAAGGSVALPAPPWTPPAEPALPPVDEAKPEPEAVAAPAERRAPATPDESSEPVPLPDPEPEPELEPAAAAPAAAPEAPTPAKPTEASAPAAVPSPRAEARPADEDVAEEPSAIPEPAPPETVWQTCEIGLWQGYVRSQFYARVTAADGTDFTVAMSQPFRSKDPLAHDEVGRSAHVGLAQQLLEQGWVADGRGDLWYELRFRLPA
jgi:hypothetical protein